MAVDDNKTGNSKEWWLDFFPLFQNLFEIAVPGDAARMTTYLIRKLNLRQGDSFLDCPCGIGRISIPLAKKGIEVTGVDITRPYLERLAHRNAKLRLPVKTVELDMRKINFDSRFDAAGNIWTSFGYFSKETDNQLVLNKLYKALKPGGRLLLHLLNRDWIVKNFTPCSYIELNQIKIVDNRKFDFKTSTAISKWYFTQAGIETCSESRIRIYSWHELYKMMSKAGFSNIRGYGSMTDAPIDSNSKDMFIIGIK